MAVYELAELRHKTYPDMADPNGWDWQRDTNCGCRHDTPEDAGTCSTTKAGALPQAIIRIPDPDSPTWENDAERVDAWQLFAVNTRTMIPSNYWGPACHQHLHFTLCEALRCPAGQ